MSSTTSVIRVFVSYTHEVSLPGKLDHAARVTVLVEDLRKNGIDATFDRDVNGSPLEGWPAWMENRVREADFVLVVCTETYLRRYELREKLGVGKGATWEGAIIRQELYDSAGRNEKFAAVVFDHNDVAFLPTPLRSHTYYSYPGDQLKLLRWLTGQPAYVPKPLGTVPKLPPDP